MSLIDQLGTLCMSKTYYTYLWLREDGTPYYVGKGQGRRAVIPHRRGNSVLHPPDADRRIIQEWPDEASALWGEVFLIAYYGRKDTGTGCLRNLTDGGDSPPSRKGCASHNRGKKLSLETRKKISLASMGKQLGHKHNLGRFPSAETRLKMSKAHEGNKYSVGVQHSEQFKRDLRERMQGNSYALGYKHSETTRVKRSQASTRVAARKRQARFYILGVPSCLRHHPDTPWKILFSQLFESPDYQTH